MLRRNLWKLWVALGVYALLVCGLYVLWRYNKEPMGPFLMQSLFVMFGFGSVAIIGWFLHSCYMEPRAEAEARRAERAERQRKEMEQRSSSYDLARIRAEARACARNALLNGCPAYFFGHGVVWGFYGLDDEFGLPIMLLGDQIIDTEEAEVEGHNQGVRETIKEYGLPWNSRKPWLKEIRNPEEYFLQQAEKSPPFLLRIGGAPATSSDGTTVISFETEAIPSHPGFRRPSLKVTSSKLWCGESFEDLEQYRQFKSAPPMHGAAFTTLPRLQLPKPASRSISLIPSEYWNRHDAATVELVFGPAGSELAFVRFHEFKPPMKEVAEVFGVLDLQLVEWIGGKYKKLTNCS